MVVVLFFLFTFSSPVNHLRDSRGRESEKTPLAERVQLQDVSGCTEGETLLI